MKRLKLLPLLIITFVIGILVIRHLSKPVGCTTVVILKNGEKINCKWINSFNSGFSSMRKCDNTDFLIETDNIKKVINK